MTNWQIFAVFAVVWQKSCAITSTRILVQKCILRQHEGRKQGQEEKRHERIMNARQRREHPTTIPNENGTAEAYKWKAKKWQFLAKLCIACANISQLV